MKTTKTAIRLTVNKEVGQALRLAKRRYPTLSDAEILKLGLSKIVYEQTSLVERDEKEIMQNAARSVGDDYLKDSEEDAYSDCVGMEVLF